jgi:hypothetical protein
MAKYGIAMPAQVVVGVTDDLAGQAAMSTENVDFRPSMASKMREP